MTGKQDIKLKKKISSYKVVISPLSPYFSIPLFLFFLLLAPFFAGGLPAQTPEMLFRQANDAYQQQEYTRAADLYKQILSRGYEGKEVYYNLGNCYYRLGETGLSVLYYEKALKLDPNDPDIRHNLDLARMRVVDRVEMPPRFFVFEWWDLLKNFYSVGQLTRIVAGLFILSILLLVFWLFIRRDRIRRLVLTFSIICGIATVFWSYILIVQARSVVNHREAIVLVPNVTVMSAPEEGGTDVFILHEGVKVHLDEQRGDWVQISLPDGKTGWMKYEALGII